MSLMDKAAFLCATRHARKNCVTVSMDRLYFLAPIGEGYIVEIEAHINYVARSSIEIELNVSAEDTLSGKQVEAYHAYFTLVALDSAGANLLLFHNLSFKEKENTNDSRQERNATRNALRKELTSTHFLLALCL